MSISNDKIEQALAPPGRVRSYYDDKERNLPFSCILRVYRNNLGDFLSTLAQDLKMGAGIKVPLDEFEQRKKIKINWGFYLSPKHPDFENITIEQKRLLCDPRDGKVFTVEDSLLGDAGIQASWSFMEFCQSIEWGTPTNKLIFDLSKLRPAGTINQYGLEASGPIGKNGESSFLSILCAIAHHLEDGGIYSLINLLGTLNDCLRRGGFKRGIICTSLRWDSPYIWDYLDSTKVVVGGHKKAVRLTPDVLKDEKLVEAIATSCEAEGTFLEKIKSPILYANVCQGIAIQDGGTCLIYRINLGQVTGIEKIPDIFCEATTRLVNLHLKWRSEVSKDKAKRVATLEQDKQVALDLMGLASFFAIHGVTYHEINESLKKDLSFKQPEYTIADYIVGQMALGYIQSSYKADFLCQKNNIPILERIHTIEPCQRHFTDCKDSFGYTTTRGIYPPYHNSLLRASDTEEQKVYEFNPRVETADEVGSELWEEFFCNFKQFVDRYGRSHGYMSFDSYKPITSDWIQWFIAESPLESLYYPEFQRFQQTYLEKKVKTLDLGIRPDECEVCSE